jgi:hypothetical protein
MPRRQHPHPVDEAVSGTGTFATSFAVMERLQIRVAFSFDDDFRQFGMLDVGQQL